MEEANKLKFPLHLTGTALQLFQLVQLKGQGTEPDVAISSLWSGVDGTLFPKIR
jgi:3-hydroxyisobutyrate dehydrogenase